MNLLELKNLLDATGLPVAYSHFTETTNSPIPNPPYITYLINNSSNLFADNKVYKKVNNAQVELYTNKKNLQTEEIIEDLFEQNEIPFETSELWIESEKLFQKTYELRLI
ncbi:hypothetical protein [Aquibacillus kalidii]|uniref:hypothetical protein n=1 Tax=Aquibacillus kalidii TaxID=2762597 RepID=UPI001646B1EC|nr:hypothetical protein [Aquibacillus kalidii]